MKRIYLSILPLAVVMMMMTIRVSNKTMMYFKSMVWIMLVMVIDASLLTNLHGICLNIVEILGCHVVIYQMHKKANTTTNSCTLFT